MKQFILLSIIALSSCSSKKSAPAIYLNKKLDTLALNIDTIVNAYKGRQDSLIELIRLRGEYFNAKLKQDEAEINYLRSEGDAKYEKQFYKWDRERVRIAKLLGKYEDALLPKTKK